MKRIILGSFLAPCILLTAACSTTAQNITVATADTTYQAAISEAKNYKSGLFGVPDPEIEAKIEIYSTNIEKMLITASEYERDNTSQISKASIASIYEDAVALISYIKNAELKSQTETNTTTTSK